MAYLSRDNGHVAVAGARHVVPLRCTPSTAIKDIPANSVILFEDIDFVKTGRARPDHDAPAKTHAWITETMAQFQGLLLRLERDHQKSPVDIKANDGPKDQLTHLVDCLIRKQ